MNKIAMLLLLIFTRAYASDCIGFYLLNAVEKKIAKHLGADEVEIRRYRKSMRNFDPESWSILSGIHYRQLNMRIRFGDRTEYYKECSSAFNRNSEQLLIRDCGKINGFEYTSDFSNQHWQRFNLWDLPNCL